MRDTQIHIDRENLLHNLSVLKNRARNIEIIPVLKANAYGHGLLECSKILEDHVDIVSIAYLNEADLLRKNGFKKDILLLVPPAHKDAKEIVDLELNTTIADYEVATIINEEAKRQNKVIPVHLFINTGMNRDGIKAFKVEIFVELIKAWSNLRLEGILSHYAASDQVNDEYTLKQKQSLSDIIYSLENAGIKINSKHISNTGGLINYIDEDFNKARTGIGIYGLTPNNSLKEKIDLKPVLSLKTRIHHFMELERGDTAGYNFKFISNKTTRLAVLPIGYGDGYSHLLTGKANCIIDNKVFPIVGSICMDLMLVDIGDENFHKGDKVILIGSSEDYQISVYDLADKIGTIPYQITTMLSNRIPRVVV